MSDEKTKLNDPSSSVLAVLESDGDSWRLVGDESWSKRPVVAQQYARKWKGRRIYLVSKNK
jgi:hypothetical protein